MGNKIDDSEPASSVDSKYHVATVQFLSGPDRGKTISLSDKHIHIDEDTKHVISIVRADDSLAAEHIATFHRSGNSYELAAQNQHVDWRVWVNSREINNCQLQPGDLIEVLSGGPVLRFCAPQNPPNQYKTVKGVFLDCVEQSRNRAEPPLKKGFGFLTSFVANLSIQTSVWFRIVVVLTLLILALAIVLTSRISHNLDRRLEQEQSQIFGLVELLKEADSQSIKRDELNLMRDEISKGISTTSERIKALETRTAAAQEIIARFTRSVIFIQGEYGYHDPNTDRPLRLMVNEDGTPLRSLFGQPAVTLEGEGPLVKISFSGTAFSIDHNGLLITNRHIALPWEDQPANESMLELGLEPEIRQILGYVADDEQSLELEIVQMSDVADVALIKATQPAKLGEPLVFSDKPPRPGDEVILLGYPAGVRALLARVGASILEQLKSREDIDVWQLTQELAKERLIQPLASRGIIAQVTNDIVAYDAETTLGGSGSPVMLLNGEVVAVNSAILTDFGGSNIGVPVKFAQELLKQTRGFD